MTLLGKLVAEKMAHARALLENVRLHRNMKKIGTEKEEIARLLAMKKAKRKNSAAAELLQKDLLTLTMKAGKQIGALVALLEQARMEFGELS